MIEVLQNGSENNMCIYACLYYL